MNSLGFGEVLGCDLHHKTIVNCVDIPPVAKLIHLIV